MVDQSSIKTALVTGGTDGIGKEVARGLARAGHTVVLVGRDEKKGTDATREISQSTGNQNVQFFRADLSLIWEVNRLAAEISERSPKLDYLVHSAGIVRGRYELTDEGIESNFAVNYLSRFALTLSLLPRLEAAGKPGQAARIVIVGGPAQNGSIHFEDVNLTKNFATLRAVLQFCHANDLFTIELARRLAGERSVTITCLKIGVVKTNIRQEFPPWMKILVPVLDPFLALTAEEAAGGPLRLLSAEEFEGVTGARFLKIKKFKQLTSPVTKDPAESERLWKLSERLVAKAQDRSVRFLETKQN